MLLHEAGCWTLNKRQEEQSPQKWVFLTAGYRLIGKKLQRLKHLEYSILNKNLGTPDHKQWMKGDSTVNTLLPHKKNSSPYIKKCKDQFELFEPDTRTGQQA
jgi:hypothetical protein